MSNVLEQLLTLSEGNDFVVLNEKGSYEAISEGVKGEIKSLRSRVIYEIFGEYPLSEANQKLLINLYKLRLDKEIIITETTPKKRRGGRRKKEVGNE